MQKIFVKWLVIFLALAIGITFVISYSFQTYNSEISSDKLIELRLDDAIKNINSESENYATLRALLDETSISKAKTIAELIASNRSYLDNKALLRLIDTISVDEIHITDGNGVIIYTTVPEFMGFDLNKSGQSTEFMKLLDDSKNCTAFAQEPQYSSFYPDQLKQFAGAKRLDEKGFVQIGYSSDTVNKAEKLQDISLYVHGLRIGENGFVLLTKGENIISSSNPDYEKLTLNKLGITDDYKNKDTFNVVIDNEKFLVIAKPYNEFMLIGAMPEYEIFTDRNTMVIYFLIWDIALFIVVFTIVWVLVRKLVISGILEVNSALREIETGNLERKVNVRYNREFAYLSDTINSMVSSLKQYIENEKNRNKTELEMAQNIQMSSLPRKFPAFPNKCEFDIYATMKAAKMVGGDLYDFYLVNDKKLIVTIGDVSGKGIPSALLMMNSKSALNSYIKSGMSIKDAITRLNSELSINNESSMFITAWIGELEIESGKLTYVNAAHNPPLIMNNARSFEYLMKEKDDCTLPIGLESDTEYTQHEITLTEGSCILLYTDGITDAINAEKKMYGKRLFEIVNEDTDANPEKLIKDIESDLTNYSFGTEQQDDQTMLALKYYGPTKKITLRAEINNYQKAIDFVTSELERYKAPKRILFIFQYTIEEIFTNISKYAYKDSNGDVDITFKYDHLENAGIVTFYDTGVMFNPITKADPDLRNLLNQPEGGLGLYTSKKMVDMSYKYEDDTNILTMKKILQ